jgi:hypothetical protein
MPSFNVIYRIDSDLNDHDFESVYMNIPDATNTYHAYCKARRNLSGERSFDPDKICILFGKMLLYPHREKCISL